jgi:hypothetical protein
MDDYFSTHKFTSDAAKKFTDRLVEAGACEREQLVELRTAAWIRENIGRANDECSSNYPSSTWSNHVSSSTERPLGGWQKGMTLHDEMIYWPKLLGLNPHSAIDSSDLEDCQKRALHQITFEALDRLRHAKAGGTPPADFSVDTSILETP